MENPCFLGLSKTGKFYTILFQLFNPYLARMSHKSSTALRYVGTGAGFVGFHARASHRCMPTLQGVDPVSPANLLETRTSTRPPFARYEFCETCGLEEFYTFHTNYVRLKD